MEVNPVHVRTLRAVVRHGSFSRAAESLRLSQPAVSLHVHNLEREVGLPLLERMGKRAFPTRAGEVLLAHAGRAFAELEAAHQALQQLRGVISGRIRLGTGATASIYLLPSLLRRLRGRYPELELIVVTGNAPEITTAVADNDLDLAIVTLPVRSRQLAVSPFVEDELVAIAPAGASWRRVRTLAPDELARHPLILYERGGTIRRVVEEWFRRGGAVPRVAMELGNAEAIKKLVSVGLGLSVTSAVSVRAEVRTGNLVAIRLVPPLSRQLGVVRRRDKPPSPALDVFLSALDDLRASLARGRLRPRPGWGMVRR